MQRTVLLAFIGIMGTACPTEEVVAPIQRDPPPPVVFEPPAGTDDTGGLIEQPTDVGLRVDGPWVADCSSENGATMYQTFDTAEVDITIVQYDGSDEFTGQGTIAYFQNFFGNTFPNGTIEGPLEGRVIDDQRLEFELVGANGQESASFSGVLQYFGFEGPLERSFDTNYYYYGGQLVQCRLERP